MYLLYLLYLLLHSYCISRYLLYLYTVFLYLFNLINLYWNYIKLISCVNQYMYIKFPFGIYFEGKACYVKFYAYMY